MAEPTVGQPWALMAHFGASRAGHPVGYTLRNPDGSVSQPRSTQGVVDVGGGDYLVELTFAVLWSGLIQWDDANGAIAREEITTSLQGTSAQTIAAAILDQPVGGPSGSIGAALARLLTAPIAIASPVVDAQTIEIVHGDAYRTSENRAIDLSIPAAACPVIAAGDAITFNARSPGSTDSPALSVALELVSGAADPRVVRLELTSAQTSLLAPGELAYLFDVELRPQGTQDVITPILGYLNVRERPS